MDFVDQMEFDRLGVFTYSQEEDTPAAVHGGTRLPKNQGRRGEMQLMELQQEIIPGKAASNRVGQSSICDDRRSEFQEKVLILAGTYGDAPKVDGYIFVRHGRTSGVRRFCLNVRITGALEYDLIGELQNENECS